jgi:arylsulfatase
VLKPLEGRSLFPILAGGTRPDSVYIWEHEGNRAIRQGDWKLVSRLNDPWELHNMRSDRLEANDLAEEMPERVAALSALYDEWADRVGIKPWQGNQTPIGRDDAMEVYGRP